MNQNLVTLVNELVDLRTKRNAIDSRISEIEAALSSLSTGGGGRRRGALGASSLTVLHTITPGEEVHWGEVYNRLTEGGHHLTEGAVRSALNRMARDGGPLVKIGRAKYRRK